MPGYKRTTFPKKNNSSPGNAIREIKTTIHEKKEEVHEISSPLLLKK